LGLFFPGVPFCPQRWGGSLAFCFYRLKINSVKRKKAMCRLRVGTKSMTGKNNGRAGKRKGKKDRGSFNKYL